jgi:cyclophilin family peptidyl-prolyl cis-trans isomerase
LEGIPLKRRFRHLLLSVPSPYSSRAACQGAGIAPLERLESRTLLASGGPTVKSIIADNRGDAILTFSAPINPSTINPGNVQIFTGGPDGLLNTADDKSVGASPRLSADGKTLTVSAPLAAGDNYRVQLLTGPGDIVGTNGKALVGNSGKKGAAGGNYDVTTTASTLTARFATVLGVINVKLGGNVPKTIANFLSYADEGDWDGTFFQRSEHQPPKTNSFVIQGGGFNVGNTDQIGSIIQQAALVHEPGASNLRGTIAMARGSDPNSATNQWFFNTKDNKGLNAAAGGGYTVFGKVADSASLKVMDLVNSDDNTNYPSKKHTGVRVVNASSGDPNSPFGELPVRNYAGGAIDPQSNLIIVTRVSMLDTVLPSVKAGQVPSHDANDTTTSLGIAGDGNPDFLYDPSTGDVKFTSDGKTLTTTAGQPSFVSTLYIASASNKLIPANSTFPNNNLDENTTDHLVGFQLNPPGFTDNFDIGDVLPAHLTADQLVHDLTVKYQVLDNGTLKPADVIVTGG